MAFSGPCALLGRLVFYRNVVKTVDNIPAINLSLSGPMNIVSRFMSIEAEIIDRLIPDTTPKPKKKISKAMKAYLQRAKEHDDFIEKETKSYEIGKRHLANMMGEDPNSFSQKDVQKAIEYLFPSGLHEPKARPIMEEPVKIFPPKKAAQFDEEGRPFHSMFYTAKPNYFQSLYEIVEHTENLNKLEDSELMKGLLPNETHKANLLNSEWFTKDNLSQYFLESLSDRDYDTFLAAVQKLVNHPYSANVQDFVMKFRKIKRAQTQGLIIPPLQYDDQGRPFIIVTDCKRKSSRGTVKILGNGTGKITINGEDITYFKYIGQREQIIFPLIFSGMENSVDVEATVETGGMSGHAGVIRWGISWGLRSFVEPEMVEKMRIAGLLTRDWRKKERKKPGQEGARRKFTWKKR